MISLETWFLVVFSRLADNSNRYFKGHRKFSAVIFLLFSFITTNNLILMVSYLKMKDLIT